MIQFLRKGLLFFVLLSVVNFIFFSIVRKLYYADYCSNFDTSFGTYLLSDSHGLPLGDFLEPAGIYNFSAGSDSYFDMRRKLDYLIAHTEVDTILITMDGHTISPFRETKNNLDRSVCFTGPAGFENPLTWVKERYVKYYFVLLNPQISGLLSEYLKSRLFSGFGLWDKPAKGSPEIWESLPLQRRKRLAAGKAEKRFYQKEPSAALTEALEEILEICAINDIEVIGIRYPIHRDYYEALGDMSFRPDAVLLTAGLPVLDFSEVYLENGKMFADEDHLTFAAGSIFADRIIDTIKVKSR